MRNKGNGTFTGYNAQAAVDDKNDVIIQTEVYNRERDRVLAENFIEKVELKADNAESISSIMYFLIWRSLRVSGDCQ